MSTARPQPCQTMAKSVSEMCGLQTHPITDTHPQDIFDPRTDSVSFVHEKVQTRTDVDPIPSDLYILLPGIETRCKLFRLKYLFYTKYCVVSLFIPVIIQKQLTELRVTLY